MAVVVNPGLDRSGEKHRLQVRGQAYSNAWRELKKGVTEAKQRYQQQIGGHFVNNNPHSMWKGIKTITDYKSSTPLTSHDATLPDALNEFFAPFDNQTSQMDTQTTSLPRDELVIILKSHQVRSTMRKIDITKAAGPDRVPGHTLKSCADQPAGVFTNIFNLSLQQALVPTCLKSTIIVRVPKKQQVVQLVKKERAQGGNKKSEGPGKASGGSEEQGEAGEGSEDHGEVSGGSEEQGEASGGSDGHGGKARGSQTTSTAEQKHRATSTAEQEGRATSTADQQCRATSTAEQQSRATSPTRSRAERRPQPGWAENP
ncbi:hypothetical protein QTP70_000572 [Hemibagrus guttatus]|uniref:Uncharacterized protein n=1 Tax=Hemibagrus guttatus TaxID=175788 RepID=A0AAE0V7V9_9TELE|nr:hypothetical protein QTP70_000572 [Hemibagrus guttatus]